MVGVTGHIDLREADRDTLLQTVTGELKRLRETYPHTPLKMLNSLAAAKEFYYTDPAVTWLEGWDEAAFNVSDAEACVMTAGTQLNVPEDFDRLVNMVKVQEV